MAGQLPQEVEIGGGEGNALPIEAHVPTRAVYLEAAELQALGRGGGDHGLLALPPAGENWTRSRASSTGGVVLRM